MPPPVDDQTRLIAAATVLAGLAGSVWWWSSARARALDDAEHVMDALTDDAIALMNMLETKLP